MPVLSKMKMQDQEQHALSSSQPQQTNMETKAPIEFKLTNLTNSIIHIRFQQQYWLCRTFLRMQEHFQHPFFRNKIFTVNEFRNWSVANEGSFSYYAKWEGFNFPSAILEPFWQGQFDPLSQEEEAILAVLREQPRPFFVIGSFEGRPSTREVLRRELSHALFHLDPEYQRAVCTLAQNETVALQPMLQLTTQLRYHPECTIDEIQARLVADFNRLGGWGIDTRALAHLSEDLQRLFNEAWRRHVREQRSKKLIVANQPHRSDHKR